VGVKSATESEKQVLGMNKSYLPAMLYNSL
jgi:hypothetical protein